ncbi:MAG: ribose 5-phosphate isomerase B [Planctomycetota bacterium]
MKVGIGSDHRGIQQRSWAGAAIRSCGAEPLDFGPHSTDSVDYPDIAVEVAKSVASGTCRFGVLICGTGIGVSIAAKKVPCVRAAVCHDLHTAEMSRRHNDANVLCLPGDALNQQQLETIVKLWLETGFEGGRHARRVEKLRELDAKSGCCS